MTQLRSESRKLWQENVIQWYKILLQVRRTMVVNAENEVKFKFLAQNYSYALFKLKIVVNNFGNCEALFQFMSECQDESILNIEKIYLKSSVCNEFKKHKRMKTSDEERKSVFLEQVSHFLEKIHQKPLCEKIEDTKWLDKAMIVKLPSIFEFLGKSFYSHRKSVFVIDHRITDMPKGFEESKMCIKAMESATCQYICSSLDSFADIYFESKTVLSEDRKRNLKQVEFLMSYDQRESVDEVMVSNCAEYLNTQVPDLPKIYVF